MKNRTIPIIATLAAALALTACAPRHPTVYYGQDGGRIGYNGIDFDQAKGFAP